LQFSMINSKCMRGRYGSAVLAVCVHIPITASRDWRLD
jgi:hypothetical protein